MDGKLRARDFSLDLMKALAIFMVCETHSLHLNESWIDNFWGITTCMGVPLFFMVNGALLFQKQLDIRKHYRKVFRTWCLCMVWKAISVAAVTLLWGGQPFANGRAPFINYLLGYNSLEGYELGHFWFLYALIGVYTVFPLLRICMDSKEGKTAVQILIGIITFFTFGLKPVEQLLDILSYYGKIAVNVDIYALNSYNLFGNYGYCLVWFTAGGFLYPFARSRKEDRNPHILAGVIFIAGWLMLFGINRFQNIEDYANGIVIDGYWQLPTLLMTFSLFYLIASGCSEWHSRLIESIARNSFGIYMLHMILVIGFWKVQTTYWFPCGIVLNTIKALYMLLSSWMIAILLSKIPVVNRLLKF